MTDIFSDLSRAKKTNIKRTEKNIQAQLELDYLQELMDISDVITANFYDLTQMNHEKWGGQEFRKLDNLIKDCEAFEESAQRMNLPLWESRMISVLSALYYLSKFKKTPTLSSFEKIKDLITSLDYDMKQLYIFKHEYATRPNAKHFPNLIFILEDDTLYADTVAAQLQNIGFETQCFGTIKEIRIMSKQIRPNLVLIDLNLQEGKLAGIDYLKEIQSEFPTLIMSGRTDLEARLESIRAGAKDYIVKPFDVDRLHVMLCKYLELDYLKKPKTLIIDDDELTALTYSKFLENYEIDTRILTDASMALEEISTHRPDIIFMDIRMPYANGYEIANVIKQVYGREKSPDIIFMTGAVKDGLPKQSRHHSIQTQNTLIKPLKPIQMANIIDEHMKRRQFMSSHV